jgi:hypothetical protein
VRAWLEFSCVGGAGAGLTLTRLPECSSQWTFKVYILHLEDLADMQTLNAHHERSGGGELERGLKISISASFGGVPSRPLTGGKEGAWNYAASSHDASQLQRDM